LLNLGTKLEEVREEVLELLGADQGEGNAEKQAQGGATPGAAPEFASGESAEGEPAEPANPQAAPGKSKTPALDAFGRDLTELARESTLDPVIGRSREIERVMQILSRRTKNN